MVSRTQIIIDQPYTNKLRQARMLLQIIVSQILVENFYIKVQLS